MQQILIETNNTLFYFLTIALCPYTTLQLTTAKNSAIEQIYHAPRIHFLSSSISFYHKTLQTKERKSHEHTVPDLIKSRRLHNRPRGGRQNERKGGKQEKHKRVNIPFPLSFFPTFKPLPYLFTFYLTHMNMILGKLNQR